MTCPHCRRGELCLLAEDCNGRGVREYRCDEPTCQMWTWMTPARVVLPCTMVYLPAAAEATGLEVIGDPVAGLGVAAEPGAPGPKEGTWRDLPPML